ncbi:DNA translocase FtsK [Pontibacillus litoralis]|nr:DNA translocase FtsK [Pontibacillus litoralis]
MKKWINQLFEDEEQWDDHEPDKPSNRQRHQSNEDIQMKMYYEYPKERSFRFPVIPDHTSEASKNNKSRNQETKQARVKHVPTNQQHESTKTRNNEEYVYKKGGPFTPTDVPSPIYGFGKREGLFVNSDVEDTPAYTRYSSSSNQVNREEELQGEEKTQKEEPERSADEPIEDIAPQLLKDDIEEVTNERSNESNESETSVRPLQQSISDNTELVQEEMQSKEPERSEINNHRQNVEQPVQAPQRPKAKRSRPFNVIMTPRDKRHYHQKETEEKTSQAEVAATIDTKPSENHIEKKYTPLPKHLLNDPPIKDENDEEWIEQQTELLNTTLKHFHVKAKVVHVMKGPSVTRFEVQPEPGVKVSKITNLTDDIKLNMAAKDIRMEAPIPGKSTIGIEVPNIKSQPVAFQEIIESQPFTQAESPLSVGLGLDLSGEPVVTDIRKMPHGLIAGATGSGKSVCINTILLSILYRSHYEDVKLLLIDPKMVELAPYNELPHLVAPVITDVKAATSALKWAVQEMERRYEKFVEESVRDIARFNDKVKAKGREDEKMPYLVIVIDELADLMMLSPQDVEDAICRIAQKARACGIHLLLATQRPSVDVITGLIKANIPTRIAFSVSSQVDSRTMIDTGGAEKLLGKGDMLFLENGSAETKRLQGAFVSDEEIERITNYVRKLAPPQYEFEQEELIQHMNVEEHEDALFEEAVEFVIQQNGASASLLQRRFKVGYNRAARLIDTMEEKGIISPSKGSKPRDVYVDSASFEEMRQNNHKDL